MQRTFPAKASFLRQNQGMMDAMRTPKTRVEVTTSFVVQEEVERPGKRLSRGETIPGGEVNVRSRSLYCALMNQHKSFTFQNDIISLEITLRPVRSLSTDSRLPGPGI